MALLPALAQYTGQTVIDGVMIRGRRAVSIAVREPNGTVVTSSAAAPERGLALARRLPLLRGLVALAEALWLVAPALHWSSAVSAGRRRDPFSLQRVALPAVMLGATAVAFVAVPHVVRGAVPGGAPAATAMLTEFATRLALVAGYVWFVLRGDSFDEALSYHAAEHQALNAYHRGGELSVDAVKDAPASHRHCSLGFLLLTGVTAMLALPILPDGQVWLRTAAGLLLIPMLAAVAFEAWRLDGVTAGLAARIVAVPAGWVHRLTVRQAAEPHLEVALAALNGAIEFESIVSEPLSRAVAMLQPDSETP